MTDKIVKELDFKIYKEYEDAKNGVNFYFKTIEFSGITPPPSLVLDNKIFKLRTIKYETVFGSITEQVYVFESIIKQPMSFSCTKL